MKIVEWKVINTTSGSPEALGSANSNRAMVADSDPGLQLLYPESPLRVRVMLASDDNAARLAQRGPSPLPEGLQTGAEEVQEQPEMIVLMAAGALVGAVSGFLLAGQIPTAAATTCATVLGVFCGWCARQFGDVAESEHP